MSSLGLNIFNNISSKYRKAKPFHPD